MEVLVTHLTRMKGGLICVAGIDLATGQHVRPVLDVAPLDRSLLVTSGGVLDVGNVVELGKTWPRPVVPEIEDLVFGLPALRLVRKASAAELWAALSRLARTELQDIFGPDLGPCGKNNMAVPLGRGLASLGCWRPQVPLSIDTKTFDDDKKILVQFPRPQGFFNVPLTDLRFWDTRFEPPAPLGPRAHHADTEIKKKREFILCVGLSRAFRTRSSGDQPVHWLQINNIHFKDEVFSLAGPPPQWAEL